MRSLFLSAVLFLSILASAAAAQEATGAAQGSKVPATQAAEVSPGQPAIRLELNKLEPAEGGCSLYFVLGNQSPDELAELQTEVYLFDREGAILRGLLFQFQNVRSGRTKVVAFAVPDLGCESIGRVLVNDVPVCTKPDASPVAGCAERLQVTSRSEVELAY